MQHEAPLAEQEAWLSDVELEQSSVVMDSMLRRIFFSAHVTRMA